ncbi:hypothetical protein T4B_13539 [Trichinella pseudospiralis]|uniref:Uncharacterized protein n=2 Tax=Trichinella pseudospiralis TaxID=6337 RepID=A0A0V0Y5S5_TRIPS|nr:hypothetical protein T4E_11128 [Trichinella pseudospiralis]KRY70644.1 hypothetical protein T4A_8364 [Trichinella pseudospiralis]KRY90602.1 hypothetical protein T4D_600 [Trichinella pseudospiralis]KRZ29377.1 hypothetical protein T4B_13539 [Trichinella pseudospiralis]
MYLSTLIDTMVQTEAQWAIIDIGYKVTVKWFIIFSNCSDGLYVYKAITLYTGVPDNSRALSAAARPISRISIDVGVLLERRNKWMKMALLTKPTTATTIISTLQTTLNRN